MRTRRPIRFAAGAPLSDDPAKLRAHARKAERLGYATFGVADHFMMPFAPLLALEAAAEATSTLRMTQFVLDQDFRHPAVLAKELATLDVLSGGRLEVGIGAGWLRAEYDQAGIRYDPAPVRIERLEEVVIILKGLFGDEPFTFAGRHHAISGLDGTPKPLQQPHPPIMIGGGGAKLLAVAGRQADIVQVMPRIAGEGRPTDLTELTARAYEAKVELVREAAGDRFDGIELGVQLSHVAITDDRDEALEAFLARVAPGGLRSAGRPGISVEDVVSSPVVAVGTLEEVCDKLLEDRDVFGFTYFAAPVGARLDLLAPVIERLGGA